ncbi:MAG: 4-(cytidine 5'-diphospho)-2-C-methyl-D-erythritol kinase [Gammaproteobacteria bacterium]
MATAWPAPGKLNLFLHITGRRADGYHLLQTVFQFIDRCDWLYFDVRDDGVIRRTTDVPGVPPEHDLTVRAAHLLQEVSGLALGGGSRHPASRRTGASLRGADIRIEKHLPMGGGLGGGSSDAATTLVALNKLWALNLPVERLAALGLQLGADVPVFVLGHAAWAEGVGEQLTPVDLKEPWYLVVAPPCNVSTAKIFSAPELTRNLPAIKISGFLAGEGINVCEPVVCEHHPQVAEALHWLSQFGQARMTGTGACVFVSFKDEDAARRALERLPPAWQGFVAKGMNQSPLFTV